MSLPAWYETYLMLHQAKVNPFNESASIPFLSDVWNVNSVFLVPTDSSEQPPSLAPFSLLPSSFDILSAGQVSASSQNVGSLTPQEVEALLAAQNHGPIPEYISAIPQQAAAVTNCNNFPAQAFAKSGPSSPLKRFGVPQQQQENASSQTGGEQGLGQDEIAKKTRRIASILHIMASKKKLDPATVSDDEARALIELQLKTKAPFLPPWYRHATN